MQSSEDEAHSALSFDHLHWPTFEDAEHLARVIKHHCYHYMHVAGHMSYFAFSYIEGHGIESYICGGLFILTAYGVARGLDV